MFVEKGTRGYLKSKKLRHFVIMLILLLVIIGFVSLGVLLNGDRKNIYTIMAVLTVLPMANLLTVLIAIFPYHAPDESEYKSVAGDNPGECFLTELAITSPKMKTIFFPYIFINDEQVFCYTTIIPGKKKEYEEYIEGLLAAASAQASVHIYDDMATFKRIAKQNTKDTDISRFEKAVKSNLLAISM